MFCFLFRSRPFRKLLNIILQLIRVLLILKQASLICPKESTEVNVHSNTLRSTSADRWLALLKSTRRRVKNTSAWRACDRQRRSSTDSMPCISWVHCMQDIRMYTIMVQQQDFAFCLCIHNIITVMWIATGLSGNPSIEVTWSNCDCTEMTFCYGFAVSESAGATVSFRSITRHWRQAQLPNLMISREVFDWHRGTLIEPPQENLRIFTSFIFICLTVVATLSVSSWRCWFGIDMMLSIMLHSFRVCSMILHANSRSLSLCKSHSPIWLAGLISFRQTTQTYKIIFGYRGHLQLYW